MGETLRVVIADDIRPFVKGLKEMLSEIPDLKIAGEAFTSTQAVQMAIDLKPDIILIDVNWRKDPNGISSRQQHEIGLAAIKQIKQTVPEVAVLAMTAHAELVEQARQHGADLSVLKEMLNDFDQLEQLLRKTIETVRFPRIQQAHYEPLTAREQQVLILMARGLTDQEIAEQLAWGIGVIKREAQSIFAKLYARNRAHAVARGYDLGLITKGSSFSPAAK